MVAAYLIERAVAQGSRLLFVAHRRELVAQAWRKLIRMGLAPAQVGVVMAGTEGKLVDEIAPPPETLSDAELWRLWARRRPAAPVQVASVDTLRTKQRPPADVVIIDEAHRSLARSYRDLVATYPEAVILGLTATPYRADGKGLGELFEDLVVIATPSLLISEGFLVAPRVWTVPEGSLPDLSKVRRSGADYNEDDLAREMNRAELVGDIVAHWRKHAEGVRTVAFAADVAHSKAIAARFVEAGVPAEHLDGTTDTAERDAILARLERGETLVVTNCGVLCEGWDQPAVKCCVLARPTMSTGLYLQQAGRILRPYQGQPAIILDHAGCAIAHGLPQDDRTFTLEAPKREKREVGAAPCKSCPSCYAVIPSAALVCTECGHAFPPPVGGARELQEKAGELREVVRREGDLGLWDDIVARWRKKNAKRAVPLKLGWCFVEFKRRHRRHAPRDVERPVLTPEQQAAYDKFHGLEQEAAGKGYGIGWAYVQMRKAEPPPEPPAVVAFVAPWDRPRKAVAT